MITARVNWLSASLGGIKPLIREKALRTLYRRRDFVGMIRHAQATLRLDMKLRVGLVNSGGSIQNPAWVHLPENMPLYGTAEFKEMRLTMHIRKSFLYERPFEMVVSCMAHELCHVILSGIHHPLRTEEEAVDLSAMILGYRDFFRKGCECVMPTKAAMKQSFLQSLFAFEKPLAFNEKMSTTYRLGYLTPEEVDFAADIMDRQARNH